MKIKIGVSTLLILCGLIHFDSARAQGTAFTYQGQLLTADGPAHGKYNLTFSLFTVASGGSSVAGPVTTNGVAITNGLFTVQIDFGSVVWDGETNWLQIGVESNGVSSFTTLAPRQRVTPVPYAIYAEGANAAGLSGTIPMASFSGSYGNPVNLNNAGNSFSGNGAGLLDVNASLLDGLASSNFWQTTGNAGTTPGVNFLGTTDNQPLNLDSDGLRGLQLQYTARRSGGIIGIGFYQYGMNVDGGFWGNTISNNVIGATIAGGGDEAGALFPLTSYANVVTDDFGAIGGGYGNLAGIDSTIPGGYDNIATGDGSFAAGRDAQALHSGAFVWSDGSATFSSTAPNQFQILATGGVGIGTVNGPQQSLSVHGGMNIDQADLNSGYLNNGNSDGYGLTFGSASGEGIASKRTSGGNQYGLDFYTSFSDRMSIANNGFVGIGTTSPSQQLEVSGEFLVVDGYTPVYAYIGDDGYGNDVQIGSQKSGVTAVAAYNTADNAYMHFYCSSITIEGGADLAEPFPISKSQAAQTIPAGSVVVIDGQHPGQLKVSDQPYDTRVAGVVSGANGVNPGIQMQQQGLIEGGKNVALTGRVYVLADASTGAIHPGDMLTTSATPGHAMKVTDRARAAGAILGKAMTGLSNGKGMVLVLVTLQ
jgi:hypothetical protein